MSMSSNDRQDDASTSQADTTSGETHSLAPEDFYYEGPYLVFTAAYHLKRGYCCNSGCRHCPYR
jgi:uncharacterized protein DUF5522